MPVHPSADPDLFIQAYEADVFLGPQAADSARAMEYSTESGPGDALLAWEGASHAQLWPGDDDDVIHVGSGADQGGEGTKSNAVWVDRCVSTSYVCSVQNAKCTALRSLVRVK